MRGVIIITGPGRSGTSFLATLVNELGFDVGGDWYERLAAGGEAPGPVRANESLIRELGVLDLWRAQGIGDRTAVQRRFARAGKILPKPLGEAGRAAFHRLRKLKPDGFSSGIRWDSVQEIADRQGGRLREIASQHAIVKDPRFCWTLPVWLAAGVIPEHVLVSVRDVAAMVASRERAERTFLYSNGARNAIVYSLGLCLATLYDAGIEHSVVRFPDFLSNAPALHAAMRFPKEVGREEFVTAFDSVRRDEAVHDWR